MNRKEINKYCKKYHNKFLNYFPKKLREELKYESYIAGGFIASFLRNEKPKDVDIFITNKETLLKAVNYIKNKYGGKIVELNYDDSDKIYTDEYNGGDLILTKEDYDDGLIEKSILMVGKKFSVGKIDDSYDYKKITYEPTYVSYGFAVTFNDDKDIPIQMITIVYGEPEDVVLKFDYLHTQNYWSKITKLVLNKKSVEAIRDNILIPTYNNYRPLSLYFRGLKFESRGWIFPSNLKMKLAMDIVRKKYSIQTIKKEVISASEGILYNIFEKIKNNDLRG